MVQQHYTDIATVLQALFSEIQVQFRETSECGKIRKWDAEDSSYRLNKLQYGVHDLFYRTCNTLREAWYFLSNS